MVSRCGGDVCSDDCDDCDERGFSESQLEGNKLIDGQRVDGCSCMVGGMRSVERIDGCRIMGGQQIYGTKMMDGQRVDECSCIAGGKTAVKRMNSRWLALSSMSRLPRGS